MTREKTSSKTQSQLVPHSKAICLNFCSYYKPDKAEDLACRGFRVLEGLMREGRQISLEKRARAVSPLVSATLSTHLCPACPFREDGCDFAAGRKGARPCGGFLLLGHLIGAGIVDVDDLANIV